MHDITRLTSSTCLRSIILSEASRPESSVVLLVPNLSNLLDFFRSQLEIQNLPHALQSVFLATGSHHYHVVIDAPSKRNLCCGDAVLLRELLVRLVEWAWSSSEGGGKWGVGRSSNVVLAVEVEQVFMLEVRVVFDLVDGRNDLGGLEDGLKVLLGEIRDTN